MGFVIPLQHLSKLSPEGVVKWFESHFGEPDELEMGSDEPPYMWWQDSPWEVLPPLQEEPWRIFLNIDCLDDWSIDHCSFREICDWISEPFGGDPGTVRLTVINHLSQAPEGQAGITLPLRSFLKESSGVPETGPGRPSEGEPQDPWDWRQLQRRLEADRDKTQFPLVRVQVPFSDELNESVWARRLDEETVIMTKGCLNPRYRPCDIVRCQRDTVTDIVQRVYSHKLIFLCDLQEGEDPPQLDVLNNALEGQRVKAGFSSPSQGYIFCEDGVDLVRISDLLKSTLNVRGPLEQIFDHERSTFNYLEPSGEPWGEDETSPRGAVWKVLRHDMEKKS